MPGAVLEACHLVRSIRQYSDILQGAWSQVSGSLLIVLEAHLVVQEVLPDTVFLDENKRTLASLDEQVVGVVRENAREAYCE